MTVVYRWQDADGRGPYKPGISHYWADEDHADRKLPPFFEEFGMDIIKQCQPTECMGCGFRSPEQMHAWFTPTEQERMRLMGYRFGKLVADRILAESDKQLVFARRQPLRLMFYEVAA
jgi:hypothetical protein